MGAQRLGHWGSSVSEGCASSSKGWNISFPMPVEDFETLGTAQDLRVVAAAVITLMSFRDSYITGDGIKHAGQANLFWTLVKTIFSIIAALILLYVLWFLCHYHKIDKKMRRIFFRLEGVILPQRPATKEWQKPLQVA